MVFFKSGDELVTQGNDLIKRKEFDKARKSFEKAIERETSDMDLAEVMIALLALNDDLSSSRSYDNVANVLRSKGDMDFEFGLNEVNAEKLANEAELLRDEMIALSLPCDNSNYATRGQKLIEVAMKYQVNFGNDILTIPETLGGVRVTGTRRAFSLFIEGNENLAESIVFTDPRKAAEYQQIAFNYRLQAGESGEKNKEKIEMYSKAATCWFCGRDVTGENIHFFPMSSDVDLMQYKEKNNDHLPAKGDGENVIFACRACYSAVSRRADGIAQYYHRQSMDEIARVAADLERQIEYIRWSSR